MDFENIIDKAKEVFEVAYKKTGEAVAAGKQKYDVSVLQNKLSKNYEALGHLCYKSVKKGHTIDLEATDSLNQKITARISRIEELKLEIMALKNQKPCTVCGGAMDTDTVFCPLCGAKNEELEDEE